MEGEGVSAAGPVADLAEGRAEFSGGGLAKGGRGGSDPDMDRRLRFLKKARERTSQALRSRDVMLAQISRTVEDWKASPI